MARQKNSVNDKKWPEVETINSYAIFMGYLLMGVRGLGFLVLTWTTVVLLGGFVSMLQKKDFWCLTAITLVQTAGVFEFLLKEKASDVGDSLKGLLAAVAGAVVRPFKKDTNTSANSSKNAIKEDQKPSIAPGVVALVLLVVQVLVLAIVLCPIAVLYMLGLYLSTGISLWRLIQHDYGNPDGGANLKPALNVLYSLVVAQGVVYGYRTIYDSVARTGLVEDVAEHCSLETELVSEYLDETVAGCTKDPSFAKGRNLVTYAVDLLVESKSRYGFISGVLILGAEATTARVPSKKTTDRRGRRGLMKELLAGSASFTHVVQRLLQTFGPTSPYSTEIRARAAMIVATVAINIRLEQFPQGMMIECISSLLDTFDEYDWQPDGYKPFKQMPVEYERDWLLDEDEKWYIKDVVAVPRATSAESKTQESDNGKLRLHGYQDLVVPGMVILQELAVNVDNCRVIMSKAEDLISKTIAPLVSDKLHGEHHDEWYLIAVESLEFMNRLTATLGGGTETRKLRSEVSRNIQATIFRTLECHKCCVVLKRQAAHVLLQLSPDTPPSINIVPGGSRSSSIVFPWILLYIFLLPDYHFNRMMRGSTHLAKKSSEIARLAGEKMQAMIPSKTEASETSMLPSVVGYVIGSLSRTVAGAENNAYRIHAATILEHLCGYYTKDDDEYINELKKALTDVVMPEVLTEIAHWLTSEEIQAVTEANNGGNVLVAEEGLDLEQCGVPHGNDNGQENSSTSHQQKGKQNQGILLQEALLDLSCQIYRRWISIGKDQDLTRQFNEMAAKVCSEQGMPCKTFQTLWYEARDKLWEEEKRASRLAAVRTS